MVLALVAMMSVGSAGAAHAEYVRDVGGGGAYVARGSVETIWCGALQNTWFSIFC